MIPVGDLPTRLGHDAMRLDDDGTPVDLLTVVDVGVAADPDQLDAAIAALQAHRVGVVVGVARDRVAPGLERLVTELDCTVVGATATSAAEITVADPPAVIDELAAVVQGAPRAATALTALLRQTAALDVRSGLAAESAVYSMLLAGPEFASWRAAHPARQVPVADEPAAVLTRDGDTLLVELNRPARRNAFDREMRDALVEGFDLVAADPSIARVDLRGRGPSFGAGGDLDEFGSFPDAATAHLIRLDRSVGARIDACRHRVTAHLHGACIGSGIELPAFAAHVHAAPGTMIRLPELTMGLVPGAGGTVSVTRRIGRWRTAFLALTARTIDARTAQEWGLVDRVTERHDA